MFAAPALSPDFGTQLLNTVATQAITHLFSQAESVAVDLGCFPATKILQGKIDSFKMQGRGLEIRRQFPVAQMSFATDAVELDWGAIFQGKLRLQHPTQAVAEIVLTEAGINQAFQAELVQSRLRNILTPEIAAISGEEPVNFSQVAIKLLPDNQVRIKAFVELPFHGQVPIHVQTALKIERRTKILFTQAQWLSQDIPEGQHSISQRLTAVLVELLNAMVDLERFDLDGVLLKLNRLVTQGDCLLLSGYAEIRHFPVAGQQTGALNPLPA